MAFDYKTGNGIINQNGYGELYKKVDSNGRVIGSTAGIVVDPNDLQRFPPGYKKQVSSPSIPTEPPTDSASSGDTTTGSSEE